jgi:hypothetical protein
VHKDLNKAAIDNRLSIEPPGGKVIGLGGKTYPAKRPSPPPAEEKATPPVAEPPPRALEPDQIPADESIRDLVRSLVGLLSLVGSVDSDPTSVSLRAVLPCGELVGLVGFWAG